MKNINVRNKFEVINQVKETFKQLSLEQRLNTFNLMWSGEPIKGIPLLNKLGNKMPGKQYQIINQQLHNFLIEYEKKSCDKKTIEALEKSLTNFYKSDLWTCRTRHLTEEMRTYYPAFASRTKTIFKETRQRFYNELSYQFLNEDIREDLKKCENWEKVRMMQEFGLT